MKLSKMFSWALLSSFFVFDNIVSYIAVTRMGGRELNSVIAPYVESYPLLYFLCIPAELIGAYLVVLLLRKWIDERIVLTSIVIYWPITNSSLNFLFILGFRGLGYLWPPLTAVGLVIALCYVVFTILRER